MFVTKKLGAYAFALLAICTSATAQEKQEFGKWVVRSAPGKVGQPQRCTVISPASEVGRLRLINTYVKRFDTGPAYRGSGRVIFDLKDQALFSDEKVALKDIKVSVPKLKDWSVNGTWRKTKSGAVVSVMLEDNAAMVGPALKGQIVTVTVTETRLAKPVTFTISLEGSSPAITAWEKCLAG